MSIYSTNYTFDEITGEIKEKLTLRYYLNKFKTED